MAKTNAGGSATQAGIDFQNRVAAWFAVKILSGGDIAPLWDLPTNTQLDFLRCETDEPVDDLLVGTSRGGNIFVQVKRSLDLDRGDLSDIAATIRQFVRQWLVSKRRTGARSWERPLDPGADRLVLVTGAASSVSIRQHFPSALRRVANGEPDFRNQRELVTWEVMADRIATEWRAFAGEQPSKEEFAQFLRLIRVLELDLDVGQGGEREALNTLRGGALRDNSSAIPAWNCLIAACAGYAAKRLGATRPQLQQLLADSGIGVKAAPPYANDIHRLKQHTEGNLDDLKSFAELRIGTTSITIKRPVFDALYAAALSGHVVVVGDPGAGKSAQLTALAARCLQEGRDVVFISVDRIGASSPGMLRLELNLNHDFAEVLENWPGESRGLIVIDALDAARSKSTAETVEQFIGKMIRLSGRWLVVASIRKFDLSQNHSIRDYFRGQPPAQPDIEQEFGGLRHINVPLLKDAELDQLRHQSAILADVVEAANPQTREIMRLPFHLRLVADLLASSQNPQSFAPVRTQIELLGRYWEISVSRNGFGPEIALRRIVQRMIEDRSLTVPLIPLFDNPEAGGHVDTLLKVGVLLRSQDRTNVTFAHNLLFDYAVARLALSSETLPALVARFETEPDLLISISPSLRLFFQYLWSTDRARFWKTSFEFANSRKLPEIAKLIGPTVAAEAALSPTDWVPLTEALSQGREAEVAGESVLNHIVGASLTFGFKPLVGPEASPLIELAEAVSSRLSRKTAEMVRPVLTVATEKLVHATEMQAISLGVTARRFLAYARSLSEYKPWMVYTGIQTVARTIATDVPASRELLEISLSPENVRTHDADELPVLAREMAVLTAYAPDLVGSLYKVAFSRSHTGQELTPHILVSEFRNFLSSATHNALDALAAIVEYRALQSRPVRGSTGAANDIFELLGNICTVAADGSGYWGESGPYEQVPNLLEAVKSFLVETVERDVVECRNAVRQLSSTKWAVVWNALLQAGGASGSLGHLLVELAWARPILYATDTTYSAGEFLKAMFASLSVIERERIESAILLGPAQTYDDQEYAETHVGRLLGCLSRDSLVTTSAKEALDVLEERGRVSPNTPLFTAHFTGHALTSRDVLAAAGVPVDSAPNRRVQDLDDELRAFNTKYLNSIPETGPANEAASKAEDLYGLLRKARAEGIHPSQANWAWGTLSEACDCVLKRNESADDLRLLQLFQEILMEAADNSEPRFSEDADRQFEEHQVWSSPSARISAASALTRLALRTANPAIESPLLTLSVDPVAAVRFQIAHNLLYLHKFHSDLFWRLVESFSRSEPNAGVLAGFVSVLNQAAGAHPDRIAPLTEGVFSRTKGKGVRKMCLSVFTGLYLWQNNSFCEAILRRIESDTLANIDDLATVVWNAGACVRGGFGDAATDSAISAQIRAFELLEHLCDLALNVDESLRSQTAGEREVIKHDPSTLPIVAGIASQLYFASGAFRSNRNDFAATRGEQERFLRSARKTLELLAGIGLPATTQHLVDILERYADLDPEWTILQLDRALAAASRRGYESDRTAPDVATRIIEGFLSRERELLKTNSQCRDALIRVLDGFVQIGWPAARRLSYRLEDIFR